MCVVKNDEDVWRGEEGNEDRSGGGSMDAQRNCGLGGEATAGAGGDARPGCMEADDEKRRPK